MFGINDALREREAAAGPIRVAVIGTGAMGGPMVQQIITAIGMDALVVIDIDSNKAVAALKEAGVDSATIEVCETVQQAREALALGKRVCSSNAQVAWSLPEIEVVVEATGNPFVFAEIAFGTLMAKKHLVTFNVEGDVVIGNILKKLADNVGVVYTGVHGDEPGVVKALYDEAEALGFEIIAAGRNDYGGGDLKWHKNNAHEYLDRFAAATVQKNLALFASFIDGSKTNEECAMIANATGLVPDVRGMHGPEASFGTFATEVPRLLDIEANGGILSRSGVVERILPAEGPDAQPVWCFVVVRVVNELQRVYMSDMAGLGNMAPNSAEIRAQLLTGGGNSAAGIFYTPYHYVSIQAPISIAYAVLHGRPSIAPKLDRRYADVMALTKKDLKAGEVIDEIGGECTAGRVEKASIVKSGGYLPFALARGAKVKRDIPAGDYLRYDDVELRDENALLVQLRRMQDSMFETDY
ncbi:MAG: NAD(P)H-dependent oxidoreductase [Mycobacterium sp.]